MQWKKDIFTETGFHWQFLYIRDMQLKNILSCSPWRAGSHHVILALKGQFQNLTSHQARSRPGYVPSKPICISFEADWRAKSLGTICATISPSCRESLAKSGLWPHVTSYDFPWPADQLHPDQHSWGEWSWSWKLWMVSVSSCETRSIFILLHRLITKRS